MGASSNIRPIVLFEFLLATAIVLQLASSIQLAKAAVQTEHVFANTCKRELENANRTISNWAENMENMVNESELPSHIRATIHNEANQILDLIEDFGEQIDKLPAAQLAKNLVAIRRRSNRMALDIYLSTFDMRWPQNSLQIGVIVERVQQACLDRSTIHALESASNPLDLLPMVANGGKPAP